MAPYSVFSTCIKVVHYVGEMVQTAGFDYTVDSSRGIVWDFQAGESSQWDLKPRWRLVSGGKVHTRRESVLTHTVTSLSKPITNPVSLH